MRSRIPDDLPIWKAFVGLISILLGLLLAMQILELLPIEWLVGMLVAMFVIGFAIPCRGSKTSACIEQTDQQYVEDHSG